MQHTQITADVLEPIVRAAGDILLSYFRQKPSWKEKARRSIVTEADVASENYLIEKLTVLMPDARIIAEESGLTERAQSNGYAWVIDPLDGTTNFASGIPYFCISVALTYNNIPVVGAVFQPITKEFFFAQSGQGAWLNGERITVSTLSEIQHAVVCCALPYNTEQDLERMGQNITRVRDKTRAVRQMGAMALDLAYTAAGVFDGGFTEGTAWWDVAAGMLLVEQAGGVVQQYSGQLVGPDYKTCVSGGAQMSELLKGLVK